MTLGGVKKDKVNPLTKSSTFKNSKQAKTTVTSKERPITKPSETMVQGK